MPTDDADQELLFRLRRNYRGRAKTKRAPGL